MANKERIKGTARKGAGKVKELAGRATNNRGLENKGKVEQLAGRAEQAAGAAQDKAEDLIERAKRER